LKFDELNQMIPYAVGGKEKVLRMNPYPNITLALPGRHAKDTTPKGGDFVVMVTDPAFDIPKHQFSHEDIFKDLERRVAPQIITTIYYKIITGADPDDIKIWTKPTDEAHMEVEPECMVPSVFFHAVQCLAVAEHRRYKQYEPKFGGRYLPFRAAAGIAEGLWSAAEASERTRKMGRPGVEWLESERGTPVLTKELMS
jgi:hypothetical protein